MIRAKPYILMGIYMDCMYYTLRYAIGISTFMAIGLNLARGYVNHRDSLRAVCYYQMPLAVVCKRYDGFGKTLEVFCRIYRFLAVRRYVDNRAIMIGNPHTSVIGRENIRHIEDLSVMSQHYLLRLSGIAVYHSESAFCSNKKPVGSIIVKQRRYGVSRKFGILSCVKHERVPVETIQTVVGTYPYESPVILRYMCHVCCGESLVDTEAHRGVEVDPADRHAESQDNEEHRQQCAMSSQVPGFLFMVSHRFVFGYPHHKDNTYDATFKRLSA